MLLQDKDAAKAARAHEASVPALAAVH